MRLNQTLKYTIISEDIYTNLSILDETTKILKKEILRTASANNVN